MVTQHDVLTCFAKHTADSGALGVKDLAREFWISRAAARVFEATPERAAIATLRSPPEAGAGLTLLADIVDQPVRYDRVAVEVPAWPTTASTLVEDVRP